MSLWRPDPAVLEVALPAPTADDRAAATPRALAAAAAAIDRAAWPRGTRLAAVLDGALSHSLVVPWNPEMRTRAEREAFARHCAHEIYGELSVGWAVAMDSAPWGRAALACAVDRGLLEGLRGLAAERGLRLVSTQPRLVRAFNAERRMFDAASFWFVVPEPQALGVLLVRDGEPALVKRVAGGLDGIDRALGREAFAIGLSGRTLPVIVHQRPSIAAAPSAAAAPLPAAAGTA